MRGVYCESGFSLIYYEPVMDMFCSHSTAKVYIVKFGFKGNAIKSNAIKVLRFLGVFINKKGFVL